MRSWSVLIGLVAVVTWAVATPSHGLADDVTGSTAAAVADQSVGNDTAAEAVPAKPDAAAFQQLRQDIQALRAAAKTQIRALLTDEQQAKFDTLAIMNGPAGHPGLGKGLCGSPGAGAPPGRRGPAEPGQHGPAMLDRLAEKLNLTDAQRTQVDAIFTQLRTNMQQSHADARQQVRALLTDEQKTQFDALRPPADKAEGMGGPEPGAGMRGPRGGGMHGRPGWGSGADGAGLSNHLTTTLNLTDAQRASVKTILDNLRASIQTRVQQTRAEGGASVKPEQTTSSDDASAKPAEAQAGTTP